MSSYTRLNDVINDTLSSPGQTDTFQGPITSTNILAAKVNEIRQHKVNWQSYHHGQMITTEDYNFIEKFDLASDEEKVNIIERKGGYQCAKNLLNLTRHIAKEQIVQYILAMICDLIDRDNAQYKIFYEYGAKAKTTPWTPFLSMLNRQDKAIVYLASTIVAKLAFKGYPGVAMCGADLQFYLSFLKDELKLNNDYVQSTVGCLQLMLRINDYRLAFVELQGVRVLLDFLESNSSKLGFQLNYQIVFCLWELSFNKDIVEKELINHHIVLTLASILRETTKDKVSRIILATFRNLLEKPEDEYVNQAFALHMVQSKLIKHLELMEEKKYDDEEIQDDLKYLSEYLNNKVDDFSTFDVYQTEVRSERLEWSPVHKSDRFWRENAMRLNENNYELLRILNRLLESKMKVVLAVAAHDIGEYVRCYPRGKRIIENLGCKQRVMQLMVDPDPSVRYEALLAVQKLMVHNWEYLGKQLTTLAPS